MTLEFGARTPFAVRARLDSAGRTAAYLVSGLLLGITHLVLLLPLLALRAENVWRLADLERKAANRFLSAHIPPLATGRAPDRPVLALLALRLPTAGTALAIAAVPITLPFAP